MKKTRLYGHSFNSGDFSDEGYDWIRDHFEYFTIEKTHMRSDYGNPSHEQTSKICATRLIEANPRCKPLLIYSIGSGYPNFFESEAEALKTNPEYFLNDGDDLNVANPDENDWYVATLNNITENSDLYGIFLDGHKSTYTSYPTNVKYMGDRITGFKLANGMDFAPNGLTIRTWPESLDSYDGVFIDAFFRRRVMTKEAGVVLIDACLAIPNDKMFVCFSAYDGYSPTYEFSHAAYLIVANENTYYRWVDSGHLWSDQSLMTWHDAFGKEMGEPLSKAVKTGYKYERVFKHCTVNIDVENITSSIVWDQNNSLVDAEGLSISAGNDTIGIGETLQFSKEFTPANATYQGVSWSVDSSTVATINSEGQLIAEKAGTVTVTAISSAGQKEANYTITVAPSVESVSLSKTELTLEIEDTTELKAIVSPEGALNKEVTWSSNNVSVASVSDSGAVIAKSIGTAVITATTKDGGFTAVCNVTVVESIGTDISLLELNKSEVIIHPNPVGNQLYYNFNSNTILQKLEVYSLSGQLMLNKKVNANHGQFDISTIIDGTYIVQFVTHNAMVTKKFIKSRSTVQNYE